METKYAPTPWRAEGFEDLIVNDANNITIAVAPGMNGNNLSESKATAHLIAAAPDLLEALINSIPYMEDLIAMEKAGVDSGFKPNVVKSDLRKAQAAIAKATQP